jgi:hypothetical protein
MRGGMIAAEKIYAEYDVRCDFGEYVQDFTLVYEGGAAGGTVTVKKPDEVAGITAEIKTDANTSSLIWQDVSLETGILPSGLSPAGIIGFLLTEWKQGFVEQSQSFKDGKFSVSTKPENAVYQTTVFSQETFLPVSSEILYENTTIMFVVFKEFKLM